MRPHSRYTVSRSSPRARGVCDRCGFQYQLSELEYQYQWAGTRLQNLQRRVCETCMDIPQEQLRAIILPPDPLPVNDPRVELYSAEVPTLLRTQSGLIFQTMGGLIYEGEITVTPSPDPRIPYTVENAIPT